MIWYVENLACFKREREAIESLAAEESWLLDGDWRIDASLRLNWDADIVIGNRKFPISLRYPNHFPDSPCLILPRGATDRWSSHQYGAGGELCLEYGPDNWQPSITGADMLRSAHRLLVSEDPDASRVEALPSRHATTIGQDLRGMFCRLLVTRSLAEVVEKISSDVAMAMKVLLLFHDECFVNIVASISMPEGQWAEPNLPTPLNAEGYLRDAVLLRVPESSKPPTTRSSSGFRADLKERGIVVADVKFVVVVRGHEFSTWILDEEKDSVTEVAVVPAEPSVARLDNSHMTLAARSVGLIGCGSLGSKLAMMLARSGVGRFLLVDDDLLLPDNFVRHDLDWRDAATHKADGVARRIKLVNPQAVTRSRKHRVGGQESAGSIESLIERLSGCDLIVDATADPLVFNYACAAVRISKKPFLWSEIFAGGLGGLIARHRPGVDPSPADMRAAIAGWCAAQGKVVGKVSGDYGAGAADTPMIADDTDVTVIAAHAARLAIDTLIPREPSIFRNPIYIIGLAPGWIFDQPFEVYPIDAGAPSAESSSESLSQEVAAEERGRIMRLLEKFSDADSSTSSSRQKT